MRAIFAYFFAVSHEQTAFAEAVSAWAFGCQFDAALAAMVTVLSVIVSAIPAVVQRGGRLSLSPLPYGVFMIVAMHLANLMYYGQSGRNLGYEIHDLIPEFWGLASTAVTVYPVYGIVALIVLIVGGLLAARLPSLPIGKYWPVSLFIALCCATVLIRGGITGQPLRPEQAYAYGTTNLVPLVQNPAYDMLYHLFKGGTLKQTLIAQGSVTKAYYQRSSAAPRHFRPPARQVNVMLIALESWPAWYMSGFGPYDESAAPNLEILQAEGLSVRGMLAGGHRTVEGLFAVLCSWPNPLGNSIVGNQLFANDYFCLPRLLKESGWATAIFQGMNKGKTGQMVQMLGAENSFGKHDIQARQVQESGWGVHDTDLYNFVLAKSRNEREPYFYIVNTTTTHDMSLPEGTPFKFGQDTDENVRRSVMYNADEALAGFVRELQRSTDEPTLLVITADHTAGVLPTGIAGYLVPFAVLGINVEIPTGRREIFAGHRDIAPTIMDLLGGAVPWFAGDSLLIAGPDHQADYFSSGFFGVTAGELLVEFDVQLTGAIRCRALAQSNLIEVTLPCSNDARELAQKALSKQAMLQTLLFENRIRDLDYDEHGLAWRRKPN
jgi:phosphoglycerol transferase MdoB-like AlkP superfamily enzyme